jgi:hypothetical protein
MNMNILALKIEVLQMGPQNKIVMFSKTALTILIEFQYLMEIISKIKLHRWYLHEQNGMPSSSPNTYEKVCAMSLSQFFNHPTGLMLIT